jgi:hypothetical protein
MRSLTVALLAASLLVPRVARADGKAECIAAFDAGQAARTDGKLAQALARFAVCARDVCPRSLQRACVEQASQTSALVPSVVLSATDGARNDLTAVAVTVDGAPLVKALDGKAVTLDPGVHTFRFEKEGLPAVERQVVVKEAQQGQPVAVVLGANGTAHGTSGVPGAPGTTPAPAAPWSSVRTAGFALGVAGAAGLAVGAISGVLAVSEYSTAKGATTTSAFTSAKSTGSTEATVSTVGFIVGGALAAGGIGLFLASPSKGAAVTASVVPTPAGLAVAGTF